jgi:hypothetical protein
MKKTEDVQANLDGFECYPYAWQGRRLNLVRVRQAIEHFLESGHDLFLIRDFVELEGFERFKVG